jgi:hypothetical protein
MPMCSAVQRQSSLNAQWQASQDTVVSLVAQPVLFSADPFLSRKLPQRVSPVCFAVFPSTLMSLLQQHAS